MTEAEIKEVQKDMIEERRRLVLEAVTCRLESIINACDQTIQLKHDEVKKTLLDLKMYVYQPASRLAFDPEDTSRRMVDSMHSIKECIDRKACATAVLADLKKTLGVAEVEGWEVNAVVIVDCQKDFLKGGALAFGYPEEDNFGKVLSFVKEAVSKPDNKAYFTRDTHSAGYLETLEGKNLPVKHCIEMSAGWMVDERLMDIIGDRGTYVNKPTFGSISLVKCIEEDIGTPSKITLCGYCSSICVLANAVLLRARFPNTKISVVEAACGDVSKEAHDAAMTVLKMQQIEVVWMDNTEEEGAGSRGIEDGSGVIDWQVAQIIEAASKKIKALDFWHRVLEEAIIALVVVGLVCGVCWLCHSIKSTPASNSAVVEQTEK